MTNDGNQHERGLHGDPGVDRGQEDGTRDTSSSSENLIVREQTPAPTAEPDRLMLDTILDLLASDRPEGLNWPGVARLVRRHLQPASPSPWQPIAELEMKWRGLVKRWRARAVDHAEVGNTEECTRADALEGCANELAKLLPLPPAPLIRSIGPRQDEDQK